MKQQFDLSIWLKDKSRKVVTREGKDVEIIYTNSPVPHHPIVGFIDKSIYTWTIDGKLIYGKEEQDKNDLFFAVDELNSIIDELKSYLEKTPKGQVEKDWKKIQEWYAQHFTNEKYNEKEELTELQTTLEEDCDCYVKLYNEGKTREELREWIKGWSPRIIDLAEKELITKLNGEPMIYSDLIENFKSNSYEHNTTKTD